MTRNQAISEVQQLFAIYNKTLSTKDMRLLRKLTDGKLYELYVLSHVVSELSGRGFSLVFIGLALQFKWSPGRIRPGDSHFEIAASHGGSTFGLYVDIEFETLGSGHVQVNDRSRRHEIDIVVVDRNSGYPQNSEVLLGVECKAVANFSKSIVKEVLGVRRELSFFADSQPSALSQFATSNLVAVAADPPSEYWLAYVDPAGDAYRDSPAAFGIEFKHLQP